MSNPHSDCISGLASSARHRKGVGLLFFDLDDTIVQAGSYVSPRVLSALRAARDAGWVLSIASGRARCMLDTTVLGAGVMDYCVCSNGATVHRLKDEALVLSRTMTCDDARACFDLVAAYEPAWNAFIGNDAYFEWKGASYMLTGRTGALARARRNESGSSGNVVLRVLRFAHRGMRYIWRMMSNRRQHQVVSIAGKLERATEGVQKLGCVFASAPRCERAICSIEDDGRFEVVRMGDTELEITAHGVTKGTSARLLIDSLGMDSSQAVAFGDGGNDLPLADAVGRFVAVANAEEHVKEAADDICPTVAEDGVAQWIECMLDASDSNRQSPHGPCRERLEQ